MNWRNENKLPVHVRAAMRDLLAEALREAAKTKDPSEGYMNLLSSEKHLDGGMLNGGWSLQASVVCDKRIQELPFVNVHAYSNSTVTDGSISADIVRTNEDRRFLAKQHLSTLVKEREELDARIKKLQTELE